MSDLAQLDSLGQARQSIVGAMEARVVGQQDTVDAMLTALFAGGHALLIGVPGLAKTLLVHSLSDALGWTYRRVQFTPDLMPSDITGTEILRENRDSGERELSFIPGPLFGNLILADEINRTPPKTQAALLESMQEHAITAGGTTHPLPDPFFVFATQNPIEQEGTYPLPEAQLDRFLVSIRLDYPSLDEELRIAGLKRLDQVTIEPVLDRDRFLTLAALVERIPVPEVVTRYAVELARASRPGQGDAWIREHVSWGAGPRASQALVGAAQARAGIGGEPAVGIEHVRSVAPLVLAHRLVPSFVAAGQGIDGMTIVEHLLTHVQA